MASIKVNVKLFGTLRERVHGYDHEKGLTVELDEGGKIRDLMRTLGLPEEESRLFFVKGVSKKLTDGLNDFDEIGIFLPLGGG